MLLVRFRNYSSPRWRFWDVRWNRWNLISVSSLLVFCLFAMFGCQYLFNYEIMTTTTTTTIRLPSSFRLYGMEKDTKMWQNTITARRLINISVDIYDTLKDQRDDNEKELEGFSLRFQNYIDDSTTTMRNFSKFIPENGGTPLRNIIVTTWRSGSTFVGDVLNSIPSNFYHYEPLLDHGIVQIRGPPLAEQALMRLKSLLNCNYAPLDKYLEYGLDHSWLFLHNTRLWEKCQQKPHICWLPEFLTPFCKLFPFQSMKVVRLRLSLFEELLNDERLNVKILYLVRDPRGTLQSRRHRDWCPGNIDCEDPVRLCADLISDYSASIRFRQKYQQRFRAVRYEDLSLEPYESAKNLLNFFGFELHSNIVKFLDSHTKANYGGVSSTFRDSKSAPFHWRGDLTYIEVKKIQRACKSAMNLWGYAMARNETHQKSFNPLLSSGREFYF